MQPAKIQCYEISGACEISKIIT
uniref:Uncharacterized protein n=1 Tax=Arundo donax TaxID=35708 RepID=A0A0A9FTB6_ARUDO